MPETRLQGVLEENVLTVLCWSDDKAPELVLRLEPKLFSTKAYRRIAEVAFDHIRAYGKPPGAHLRDILDRELRHADAKMLRDTLDAMDSLRTDMQLDYIMSELNQFIHIRSLYNTIEVAAEFLDKRDPEAAEEALRARPHDDKLEVGTYMSDSAKVLSFMDQGEEEYFSTGVDFLDERGIRPARGEAFVFLAPKGKGKTWFVINAGKANMLYRKSVLHVSLEMEEPKIARRYAQSLFSLTKREAGAIRVPFFVKDELGQCSRIDFNTRIPDVLDESTRARIAAKLDVLKRYKPILIKDFPSGTLTVPRLSMYLDFLERSEGFKPDVLIVDYPRLMKQDAKNLRISLGQTLVDLRGLAKERNCAVLAPAQSNRTGAGAKLVTSHHMGEDYSLTQTADIVITYSQTDREHRIGLARLFVDKGREEADGYVVLVAQNYATGQFCLDSAYLTNDVQKEVGRLTGENEDADE